jgi:hypothetical protein
MLDRRPAHPSLIPARRTTRRDGIGAHSAGVAQPAEHLFCKQAVGGSTPPVSSTSSDETPEGCPSGQREQAVNLPAHAYVGSNPTPSTSSGVSVAQAVTRPSRASSRARRPRRFLAGLGVSVAPIDLFFQDPAGRRGGAVAPRVAYGHRRSSDPAGVAQLVEHQPSKLNVVGSSPISRSLELAHIAQLAERVLGKDEVTSSNLVVGSPLRGRSPRPARVSRSGPSPKTNVSRESR